MGIAFLFPGQGSQTLGMLHQLPKHEAVLHTLEEISDILKMNALHLDSAESLESSICVQLALLASAVAMARAIEQEGIIAEAVAGHSVGAFGAAVHCGVISLADSVVLVRQRAELMVKLYPKGYGLAAIIGLTEKQVIALIFETQTEADPIFLACVNAPRQIVISGSKPGIERLLAAARRQGATRAKCLPVSVPSHCPLLEPVAEALKHSIDNIPVQRPRMVYLSNVRARALRTSTLIAEDLANNISHCVRWHDATTVLEELGCRIFMEMPPGSVLSDLAKDAMPELTTIAVSQTSLEHLRYLGKTNSY